MLEQKTKSPAKRKWLWIGGAALLIILLLIVMLSSGKSNVSAASLLNSAAVERGDITTTVIGTGTLESGETRQIQLPVDLTIESYYVQSGDYVTVGDPIAKVSNTSLVDAIDSLSSELAALDRSINSASATTKTVYTTTNVSGRVKAIYAQAGDSVAQVLNRDGALALISTDGKMAVGIDAQNTLATGDEVEVVLSDGTVKTGTVEAATASSFYVTLTDNGPALGENVSVRSAEGTVLGSGALTINQPVGIIGVGGTVKSVSVSENQYIYSGATVMVLQDVPTSGGYQDIIDERNLVAEALSMLVSAANNNGVLAATFSGTVTAVGGESSSSSSTGSAYGLSLGSSGQSAAVVTAAATPMATMYLASANPVTEIGSVATLISLTPVTGETPATEVSGQAEYSGTVAWEPAASVFLPGTSYKATVTLTASVGYKFPQNFLPVISGATVTSSAVDQDSEQNILTFTVACPATASEQTDPGFEIPSGGFGGMDYSGYLETSGSTLSGSYSTQAESALLSSICTIASDETVILNVTIDELDVNDIEKGNVAQITFDAIDGVFTGEVTRISNASSSGSGSAKYRAEILVDKDTAMRIGMNATATITVGVSENILLIPVDAVQETGGRVFVYTQSNEDGTQLSGEVDIVTGLSDGRMVEVLAGLSESDTVYYIIATAESTDSGFGGMGMGGMGMGGMSENLPSGFPG